MTSPGAPAAEEIISFINRDHIISVTIRGSEIVVTTTGNSEITIPVADQAMLSRFADDLANSVQSNDRFVDEGLDFGTVGPKVC
jgi:hypothetical protein